MDTETEILKLVIYAVVSIILFSIMMYQIIFHGSYGRKIWRESVKQRNLLVEIAKRQGVEDHIIDEILDDNEEVTPVK